MYNLNLTIPYDMMNISNPIPITPSIIIQETLKH